MSDTDLQLLARHTRDHDEDAFAEIVRRHLDLVHSAALRQVRSLQLAEEVAQSAFTDLARNAHRLARDTILTAWLYQVTRRTAIDVVRREARRQLREQIATEMNAMNASGTGVSPVWSEIEPLLDEAMSALDDSDRAAVLLRYFENKSLHEVGAALGTSDDAAQKRVSRAVERLREFFARRGVSVRASGLVVVISANAVQAAPVGLAMIISTVAALTGTSLAATATITATKAIAMTTLQKSIITATIAVLAVAGIYEARQASQLRDQVQALQQQQVPLTEKILQLENERDEATRQLASLRDERGQSNRASAELLKLRSEVARLRADSQELAKLKEASSAKGATNANDFIEAEAQSLVSKAHVIKQLFEKMPEKKIPELQFLGAQAWLNAAQLADVETEAGITKVMSKLRTEAKNFFTAVGMQPALDSYTRANSGQLPSDISQLKPYFEMIKPGDDVLQRYQVTRPGNIKDLQPGDIVIEERHPVDEHYDTLFQFGLGTWSWHGIGANTKDSGKAGSWRGPPANE